MLLNIHTDLISRLDNYCTNKKVPHLIFHGESGSGKRTLVHYFINKIYNENPEYIKKMVIHVNCAHGKGIKFIREELKFFAKTHINIQGGNVFKSIILFNADKLTIDAQSALRRCIELFSHTTRFFIVIEDKYKLLMPILSRFCEIYVPPAKINGTEINLHRHRIEDSFNIVREMNKRLDWLKKELYKLFNNDKAMLRHNLMIFASKSYEKGYSALDIAHIIEYDKKIFLKSYDVNKYNILNTFEKVKPEFRNEKLLIVYILDLVGKYRESANL